MPAPTENPELPAVSRHETKGKPMSNDANQNSEWFSSSEAREKLRISSCELMHLREAGQLRFKKQGNAFLYSSQDVERQNQADSGHTPASHTAKRNRP